MGVYQVREVCDHIVNKFPPSALQQPEHGEIRVPVIQLAKAAAGNDVGAR
jgi:hypothetical protein